MKKRIKRVFIGISIIVAVAVIATTSCITASVVWPVSGGTLDKKTAGTYRLITLNIAHGRGLALDQRLVPLNRFRRNLEVLGGFLQLSNADFVAMQEIDADSDWNGNFDHLAEIKSHTDFVDSAFGINNVKKGRYQLHYGNALLSRFPIEKKENFPFGSAALGEKGFLYTEMVVNGHRLPVINTHLDYRSRATRIRQLKILIDWLEVQRNADPENFIPPIIVGDFNSRLQKKDSAARYLFDYLESIADYQVYPMDRRTFPTYEPAVAIDLMFIPPQIEVKTMIVPRIKVSDHLPVIVDFVFRGEESDDI